MKEFKIKNRDVEHMVTDIGAFQLNGKNNTLGIFIDTEKKFTVYFNDKIEYYGKSLYHALLKFHRKRKFL